MDAEANPTDALYLYLSTVLGLSILIVLMLVGLFGRNIPQLTSSMLLDPAGTVQAEPVSIMLFVGIFLALLSLFASIVVFAVKYEDAAPEPPEE